MKFMIFENPLKFMKIHDFGYPGRVGRMTSTKSIELEKSINMMCVVAVGGPESRNKLGRLVVMSL